MDEAFLANDSKKLAYAVGQLESAYMFADSPGLKQLIGNAIKTIQTGRMLPDRTRAMRKPRAKPEKKPRKIGFGA